MTCYQCGALFEWRTSDGAYQYRHREVTKWGSRCADRNACKNRQGK